MQVVSADLVCWAAGSLPSSRAGPRPMQLPFPVNDRGVTCTEATLRVARHANVFALGDIASTDGAQLPPTAQAGCPAPASAQLCEKGNCSLFAHPRARPKHQLSEANLASRIALGDIASTDGAQLLPTAQAGCPSPASPASAQLCQEGACSWCSHARACPEHQLSEANLASGIALGDMAATNGAQLPLTPQAGSPAPVSAQPCEEAGQLAGHEA